MERETPDTLALAYQAGQRQFLGDLYRALEPLIARALRLVLTRYVAAQGLPSALEAEDLAQQSWIALAELAQRWRPSKGSFSAYLSSSLPWTLGRYVRRHSPNHRAARVRVISSDGEKLLRLLDGQAGDDGRHWAEQLGSRELLARLPERQRAAFILQVVERDSISAVATALGVSGRTARRLLTQARRALREQRTGAADGQVESEPTRLVYALHEGAGPDGALPGRAWVCARTGLSQSRYAQLMQRLVTTGCVRDRSARRTGRLVEADVEATLRRATSHGTELTRSSLASLDGLAARQDETASRQGHHYSESFSYRPRTPTAHSLIAQHERTPTGSMST